MAYTKAIVLDFKSSELDWQDYSLCGKLGEYRHLEFYPELEENYSLKDFIPQARVCNSCPVKTDCYEYDYSLTETSGIWGGILFTGRDRRILPTE